MSGRSRREEATADPECELCSLPVPATPITGEDVEGSFCCRGCLEVQRALGDVPDVEAAAIRDAVEGERDTERTSAVTDGESAFLTVEGMHCTTCEAFIEGRSAGIDGVDGVAASYATDTVRVVYDPDVVEESELPELLSGYGYTAHDRSHGRSDASRGGELAKFLVGGGLFGMMVMVWYAIFLYPTYFGYDPIVEFGGYDGRYVVANIWLMSSFVLFYTGWPILRGAVVSLRAGVPNMDLLVSIAALSAYAYSTLAMVVGRTDLYFDVSVAIVLVVTAGTYYEGTIKRRAVDLLSELTAQQAAEARLLESGDVVPVADVEPGTKLLVRPGERIPLDGTVVEGAAAVDESLVTGESHPVEKAVWDHARGGTVVTDAALVVEVGPDAESTVDRLVELLWSIQSSSPGVQRLADKLATVFVPLVIVVATIVTGWLLLSGAPFTTALLLGLTVLIVSCPCALGLATPLAIASGLRAATERGIVVATESVFEDAPNVDVVVLDKTGTLTEGSMSVASVYADRPDELLRRAAAVEALSEHPIASAIVEHADATFDDRRSAVTDGGTRTVADPNAFDRDARGVSAPVDGTNVVVGHPELLRRRGFGLDAEIERRIEDARRAGDIPVVVGWGDRGRGVIVVTDRPRAAFREAVETLSDGRDVVVLTGDEGRSADRFRDVDGVDELFAGVPPEGKAEAIRRLRRRGTVAMVGDGTNDAPALAAADLGIALGSGTKLATDAADAVIVTDELRSVGETFAIAERTNGRIKQNLAWAFVYNGIAIPLAISGLLNPLLAAVAMAASSTIVVGNSIRPLLDE